MITVGSWGGIGIRSAIKRENVFNQVASPVHPGAKRYFEEIGMSVPKGM